MSQSRVHIVFLWEVAVNKQTNELAGKQTNKNIKLAKLASRRNLRRCMLWACWCTKMDVGVQKCPNWSQILWPGSVVFQHRNHDPVCLSPLNIKIIHRSNWIKWNNILVNHRPIGNIKFTLFLSIGSYSNTRISSPPSSYSGQVSALSYILTLL